MPAVVPIILGAAAYTGVSAAIGTTIAAAIGVSSIGAVAAAAIGTGVLSTGISLAQGQNIGDAIKSGVLSGATSFVGGTIGSYISSGSEAVASAVSEDAAFIAADAAQMAQQGLSQNQIAYNLAASGVNAGTAEAASITAILNSGTDAGEIIDSILHSMPVGASGLFVDAATQSQYANLGIEPPVAGAEPTYDYASNKWAWKAPDGTLYNQAEQILEYGEGGILKAVSPIGDNTLIAQPEGFGTGATPEGIKVFIDPVTGTSINAYTGELVQYGTNSPEWQANNWIDADGVYHSGPAPWNQPAAPVDTFVPEAVVTPVAPPVVDPNAVPAWMPEGTTQVTTSTGETGFRIPGDNVVYDRTGQILEVQQAAVPTPMPTPENTIPVTLPDGTIGAYDPATDTVYDGSGNTVAATTPPSNAGTQVASGPSEVVTDAPFRVEYSGVPGTAEFPETAIREYMTPGTDLATRPQIDAGEATWNPAANAWEVNAPVVPLPEVIPTLPEVVITAPAIPPVTDVIGGAVGAGLGSMIAGPVAPPVTQPVQQPVQQQPPAQETEQPVVTPPVAQPPLSPLEQVNWPPSQPIPEVVAQPPLSPLEQVNWPPSQPIPEVVAPVSPVTTPAPVTTTPPGGNYADVGGAIGAVIGAPAPAVPPPATRAPYGPIPPTQWGTTGGLVNPGLNPGFIDAQEFYNTTSPVQSKFYYGQHPYQPGPVFDPLLYNNVPGAPNQPWGLQQMYTPTDLNAVLARYGVAGPVAPPRY